MTRRSTFLRFGIPAVVILLLLAVWQSCYTYEPMDSGKAGEIALDHLKSSPYLESIDTTRISIVWQNHTQAWVVDFAWKAAGHVLPGLWAEGYYVVVDARSGHVKEAHAYER